MASGRKGSQSRGVEEAGPCSFRSWRTQRDRDHPLPLLSALLASPLFIPRQMLHTGGRVRGEVAGSTSQTEFLIGVWAPSLRFGFDSPLTRSRAMISSGVSAFNSLVAFLCITATPADLQMPSVPNTENQCSSIMWKDKTSFAESSPCIFLQQISFAQQILDPKESQNNHLNPYHRNIQSSQISLL